MKYKGNDKNIRYSKYYDWKKKQCHHVVRICKLAGYEALARKITECSNFTKRPMRKITRGGFYPYGAPLSISLCRDKLCPICQDINKHRSYSRNITIAECVVKNNPSAIFYFMTFTIKNTMTLDASIINDLMEAFKKLTRRKEIADYLLGYYRSIEVTHNGERGYHPHIHAIMVFSSTFGKGTRYIKKSGFQALWQESLGDKYVSEAYDCKKIPNVNGTFISTNIETGKKYEMTTAQAIANRMCYMAKHVRLSDYTTDDDDKDVAVFSALYTSLYGVKMIMSAGKNTFRHKGIKTALAVKKARRKQEMKMLKKSKNFKEEVSRYDGYSYKPIDKDDT